SSSSISPWLVFSSTRGLSARAPVLANSSAQVPISFLSMLISIEKERRRGAIGDSEGIECKHNRSRTQRPWVRWSALGGLDDQVGQCACGRPQGLVLVRIKKHVGRAATALDQGQCFQAAAGQLLGYGMPGQTEIG